MRRLRRTRFRQLLTAACLAAALAPVWLTLAATSQHACYCGLERGCRCELSAAPKAGAAKGHGHCAAMERCAMGRTHAPSDNALFAGLDGRGWFALPEAGEPRVEVAPSGTLVPLAVSPAPSLVRTPETPPPRSSGSVV
jgi:hypothetical protein